MGRADREPDNDPEPAAARRGQPLTSVHDVVLLDLDGTVYRGRDPIPGAAAALAAVRAAGVRTGFVTNNASQTPEHVAGQLASFGIPCTAEEVLTSAQAGARLLAARVAPGSAVLAVGGEGLVEAVRAEGLEPVGRAGDRVAAVVQGWAPDLGWRLLAEGAYALASGVPWVVTNSDVTLPTARGIAPGNGSFVRLLAGVVGREPDAVAGKPGAEMLRQAAVQLDGVRPLVVGDRLDTDVAGAVAAELPSFLVLTGVTGPLDVLGAVVGQRPTYVAADLTGLLQPQQPVVTDGSRWTVAGSWAVVDQSGTLRSSVSGAARATVDDLRACAAAAWDALDHGRSYAPEPGLAEALAALGGGPEVSSAARAAAAGPSATRPA